MIMFHSPFNVSYALMNKKIKDWLLHGIKSRFLVDKKSMYRA